MFGQNKIAKVEVGDGQVLKVVNVFHTIQGEGPSAGMPAVFVRLLGCTLACTFCDTQFEKTELLWAGDGGEVAVPVLARQVIQEMKSVDEPPHLVVITGGEPLRQNLVPFLRELLQQYVAAFNSHALTVEVETSGSTWTPLSTTENGTLDIYCAGGGYDGMGHLRFIVSPKTPRLHKMFFSRVRPYALKYIVSAAQAYNEDTGLPTQSTQRKERVLHPGLFPPPDSFPRHRVFVQPMDEYDEDQNRANREWAAKVAMRYGYRVSIQTHKLLGVE